MQDPRLNARRLSATALWVVALAILLVLPLHMRAAAQDLIFWPPGLHYGHVVVGQSKSLLVAVTNNSQANVTISGVTASTSNFQVSTLKLPQVLAAGESLLVNVTFAPSAPHAAAGVITVISNGSNPTLTLPAAGGGVTTEDVTMSPASLSFGNVDVGTSSMLPVDLTNNGHEPITLSSLQTEGRVFSVTGATFPVILAVGQSVKLNVTFKPKALGLVGGSSFVGGPGLDIPFTGTGTPKSQSPQMTIAPATLSFGKVAVGTTMTLSVGLTATGGSVTVSSVSSSGSQFTVPGVTFPFTIPAGQDATLNVAFKPQRSGKESATLSFASNAAKSLTPEAATGTGTVPFVSLSWIASTSAGVQGYNVYRKTSPTGSYTRLNSTLNPETTYSDSTVVGRTTYYYATTAVNSKGKESNYSNRIEVVVP